eukprot:g6497.t1
MELEFVLLISVFVIAFGLPCVKMVIYDPIYAWIHAKDIIAQREAELEKKRAAREAKRKRDEERRLELERRIKERQKLREKEREMRKAHELMQQLANAGTQGGRVGRHGNKRGPWDPFGLKRKRAMRDGRWGRPKHPRLTGPQLEPIVADPTAIARLIAEAHGTAPPTCTHIPSNPMRPGGGGHESRHEKARRIRKLRRAQGSSAFVFGATALPPIPRDEAGSKVAKRRKRAPHKVAPAADAGADGEEEHKE